jgi:hypothetical protein
MDFHIVKMYKDKVSTKMSKILFLSMCDAKVSLTSTSLSMVLLSIRNYISKTNRQHNGPKKVQKDKQRSTKHTYKSKDRVARTPLKLGMN